jgi:hypothetical protein
MKGVKITVEGVNVVKDQLKRIKQIFKAPKAVDAVGMNARDDMKLVLNVRIKHPQESTGKLSENIRYDKLTANKGVVSVYSVSDNGYPYQNVAEYGRGPVHSKSFDKPLVFWMDGILRVTHAVGPFEGHHFAADVAKDTKPMLSTAVEVTNNEVKSVI